jgi:hypothetical protein
MLDVDQSGFHRFALQALHSIPSEGRTILPRDAAFGSHEE